MVKYIKDFFVGIFKRFDKDGFKGMEKYILLIGAIILFIGPMVVFSSTFGKKLYIGLVDYEKIALNIILNTVLFVVLYIVGSIREVDVKDEDRSGFNIFMTLILMGIISFFIAISYFIYKGFTESVEVKIGIALLFLFILIIVAHYILQWVILIRELNSNLKKAEEKTLQESDNDEVEDMEDDY